MRKRKRLRENLNIGEKVYILAERTKKKSSPGKFYKQSVQNISYFNKDVIQTIRKKHIIDNIRYYWVKTQLKISEDRIICFKIKFFVIFFKKQILLKKKITIKKKSLSKKNHYQKKFSSDKFQVQVVSVQISFSSDKFQVQISFSSDKFHVQISFSSDKFHVQISFSSDKFQVR